MKMTLSYGPRHQAQALRQRLRALRPRPLVVVEGSSDRNMMSHLLAEDAHVQYLRGKSNILPIVEELAMEFPDQVLFLVDCDDAVEDRYKGLAPLVITEYRDLDADIVFALDAWLRIAAEFYVSVAGGAMTARSIGLGVLEECTLTAIAITRVRVAARHQGASIRMFRPERNSRSAFRPLDMPDEALGWMRSAGDVEPIVQSLESVFGWNTGDAVAVRHALAGRSCSCRHARVSCPVCDRRRLVNGHDLIELLGLAIARDTGRLVNMDDLYSQFRIGADLTRCQAWPVATRIRAWELRTGVRILRGDLSA